MRRHVTFLFYSFLVGIFLVAAGGSVFAAEPGSTPSSGIENLLRGTKYEQLLIENRGKPSTVADKGGFVPNFGNYFDATNVGWGLDIQGAGDLIFAVWFTYLADGSPYWYIIVGELEAKGGGMSMTGDINSFKWDAGGAPNSQATATNRGTMTIDWKDASDADVTWTLDGDDGSASVSFAVFASGPAIANVTGHYFDFTASGWGYTLLTQGSVTVLTMYWYKDGQPVWAQGVSTTLGFSQIFALVFFDGPGLCPSCLDKGVTKGGATSTPLEDVRVDWVAEDPPIAGIVWTENIFKGGPLGPEPFGDIALRFGLVTTQAFTSAFTDNFDPAYHWLSDKAKGPPACFPFQYDSGIIQPFPPAVTGNLQTAYIGLDKVDGLTPVPDGLLPVYSDSNCNNPLNFNLFGTLVPSFLRMGSTGDDGGFVLDWTAELSFVRNGAKGSSEREHRHAPGYDPECEACRDEDDDDDDDRASKGEGTIYVYGISPTLTFGFEDFVGIAPFPEAAINPPTQSEILDNPEDGSTVQMTIP